MDYRKVQQDYLNMLVEHGSAAVINKAVFDLDLDFDKSYNSYNEEFCININEVRIKGTTIFITQHKGGDPRGNYENKTYVIFCDNMDDTFEVFYTPLIANMAGYLTLYGNFFTALY
jgi:hypothetical protein